MRSLLAFDRYAFTALGLSAATIDNSNGLKEQDFPTEKVQRLKQSLLAEKDSIIKFLQTDVVEGMEDIKAKLEGVQLEQAKKLEETAEGIKDELRDLLREQRPSKLKSHLFPMVPHFTGRVRECDDIMDHLTTQPTKLVSVWGSPGFGKTSVATAVGHKLHSQGHLVLFTSLRQVKSVSEMVQRILTLSPQRDQTSSQDGTAKTKVLNWISSVSRPLFLFLDNSDDLLENKEDYLQFLREILACSTTVKLLCTTRESLECANYWFPTASFRIQPLDKSSSRRLVQTLAPNVVDNDIVTITNVSGDVPLVIKLVCSIVTEWEEFVSELDSSPMEALDMPDTPADLRLKFLFQHCFRSLRSDQQRAFVCLSVFTGAFYLFDAMAALNVEKSLAAKKSLDEIVGRSLLEYDAEESST